MTSRRSTFRRLVATVAVSAMPITAAGALLTAQPAAAQFGPGYPGVSPFGTSGFYGGSGITFAPNNSTTEINNYGSGNTTVVDDGNSYDDGYYGYGPRYHHNYDWDFPWWNDGWSWHPGWDDGWDGGWW